MANITAELTSPGFPGTVLQNLDLEAAFAEGDSEFDPLLDGALSGDVQIISASSTRIVFEVGGNRGELRGDFAGPVLVINRFSLDLPNGGGMGFTGFMSIDTSGNILGDVQFTSMFIDTASFRFGFTGNVFFDFSDEPSGSITRFNIGINNFNVALEGNFTVSPTEFLSGNAFAVTISDRSGDNHIRIQGLNATLDELDGYFDGVTTAQALLSNFDLSGNDTLVLDFTFGANINAQGGNDHLQGGRGNDTLDGGAGADNVNGQGGNDSLLGGEGNDVLGGFAGNDTLDGGAGDDILEGAEGNDVYYLRDAGDSISFETGGSDEVRTAVDFSLAGLALEHLTLLDGAANGTGNEGANRITGNAGANSLVGAGGADTLEGAGGDDTLSGGLGNDVFVVADAGDAVVEAADGGTDTVRSTLDWTLGSHLENLVLLGTGDLAGTGNALANVLTGNAGDNVLDGRGGADTLIGGAGNDTYILGAGDVVIDTGGSDTALSEASFHALPAGLDHVSLAQIAGNAVINGSAGANHLVGNVGGNVIQGGDGHDTLEGGKGDDTLVGGNGNDVLDGGRGADRMEGGAGNDYFIVSATRDEIVELAGGGTDTVEVQAARYAMAANVENAVVARSEGARIEGNDLANRIDGGEGADWLEGGAGNDIFVFDLADRIEGGDGLDVLRASPGESIDLRGPHGVFSIEAIDLRAPGIDVVRLDADGVRSLNATGTVRIDGNVGDKLLTGGGWTQAADVQIGGRTYAQYAQDGLKLQVESSVTVQASDVTFMNVLGEPTDSPEPIPGFTFVAGTGDRVDVSYDPDYNQFGGGTDDMWWVEFDANGVAVIYTNMGAIYDVADVSEFAGWVGGTYIGVGTTGELWDDIRNGTYWLGDNQVLYSANLFDSDYTFAIN